MKKIFLVISIVLLLTASLFFSERRNFPVFLTQKMQERMKNTPLPNPDILRIFTLGHTNTYADWLWISMIQYVGNHLTKENFSDHAVHTIERLVALSPKFTTAYEWALWLMPIPQNSNLLYSETQKQKLQPSLKIAYKGIQELCDTEKISRIDTLSVYDITKHQQENTYTSPCKSGMLPYLIAFYGGQLVGNHAIAERFYKIASFHQDTPEVSPILAIISGKPKDNPKAIAENFTLMALGGYDIHPYSCIQSTNSLLHILQKESITLDDIHTLQQGESSLSIPNKQDTIGQYTCYEFFERSVKYTYLSFINEEAKKYPHISDTNQLLQAIGLTDVPMTQSQDNMTLIKNNNIWEYTSK